MNKSCACGSILVEFEETEKFGIARMCSCKYCRSQNAEYISSPRVSVMFEIRNKNSHKIIKHGFNSAEFHECINCGLILVTCTIEGAIYCTLNARGLGVKDYTLEAKVRDFSDESLDQRLSRRKTSWCPAYEKS